MEFTEWILQRDQQGKARETGARDIGERQSTVPVSRFLCLFPSVPDLPVPLGIVKHLNGSLQMPMENTIAVYLLEVSTECVLFKTKASVSPFTFY